MPIIGTPNIANPTAMTQQIQDHAFDAQRYARHLDGEYGASIFEDSHRLRMIAMRLHLNQGVKFPFQHISTAVTTDHVLVFVVQKDQYVVLKDDRGLFPSDTLVTQLRLLT